MNLAPPRQPLRCTNPDCGFADGGRCARAAEIGDPSRECPDLLREPEAVASNGRGARPEQARPTPPSADGASETMAPWTGRHLDPAELGRMRWRAPPRLIAVLGDRGAGKTSLLTSFFLQLASGQRGPFAYRFAGSRTLQGLNTLCSRAERWDGVTQGALVDYTVRSEFEDPRLFLHLALQPLDDPRRRVLDVALTDLPGEWVADWAQRQDDDAERRLGFLDSCDGLVVLADVAALRGSERAIADNFTALLLRRVVARLGSLNQRVPLALVWSKYDRAVDAGLPPEDDLLNPASWGPLASARRTWAAVREATEAGLPLRPFAVSAFPGALRAGQPVGVMSPFAWLLAQVDAQAPWTAPALAPPPPGAGSFAALRRWPEAP